MPQDPALSVVVPVFDGAGQVGTSVERLLAGLAEHVPALELVFVDDGSADGTRAELEGLAREEPRLVVASYARNRGKGYAVRHGMLAARGRVRVFTDVDVPYGCEAILEAYRIVAGGEADIVVGDRTLATSAYRERIGPVRQVASVVFSFLVQCLAPGAIRDTQCGLKGFDGEVARHLFGVLRQDGFALDAEMLYLCRKYGLSVHSVPVRLEHTGPSSVSVLRVALPMLTSICTLRLLWRLGRYREPWLAGRRADGA